MKTAARLHRRRDRRDPPAPRRLTQHPERACSRCGGPARHVAPADIRAALESAEPLPLRLEWLAPAGDRRSGLLQRPSGVGASRGRDAACDARPGARRRVLGAMRELGRRPRRCTTAWRGARPRSRSTYSSPTAKTAPPRARLPIGDRRAGVFWFLDAAALVRFLPRPRAAPSRFLFKVSRAAACDEAARQYLNALDSLRATNGGVGG